MRELDIALKAVELHATMHPRPCHVTQKQASEMMRVSVPTVRKYVKSGILRLNACGMIPITDIDRAIS